MYCKQFHSSKSFRVKLAHYCSLLKISCDDKLNISHLSRPVKQPVWAKMLEFGSLTA